MSTNLIKIRTLPEGETLLWQGQPSWRGLALRAFHVKSVILYFTALLALHAATSWWFGMDLTSAARSGVWLLIPMLTGPALLALFAWLTNRTTHYTITNRRVLMQFGIALPITLNIPFRQVTAAAVKSYKDGSGDIPLMTNGEDRLAYILLWPHVRPWHFKQTEPMLRAVPNGAGVAETLANALKAASAKGAAPSGESRPDTTSPAFAPASAAA